MMGLSWRGNQPADEVFFIEKRTAIPAVLFFPVTSERANLNCT
jgi:hypothetical protein